MSDRFNRILHKHKPHQNDKWYLWVLCDFLCLLGIVKDGIRKRFFDSKKEETTNVR